jgi:AraC-like DNA-binding protein
VDPRIRIILRIVAEQKTACQMASREASTLIGLSEAYFLRLFHRHAGVTFGHYLREIRMASAAALVKDHTLSIKAIALNLGYNDVSNFYRDFKHVHGMGPRELRLRYLSSQPQKENVAICLPPSPQLIDNR